MTETAVELKHVVGGKGPWVTLVHSLALNPMGEDDQATPPAMGHALANGIDGTHFHLIRGSAHQASIEQQGDFDAQPDAFFAGNA